MDEKTKKLLNLLTLWIFLFERTWQWLQLNLNDQGFKLIDYLKWQSQRISSEKWNIVWFWLGINSLFNLSNGSNTLILNGSLIKIWLLGIEGQSTSPTVGLTPSSDKIMNGLALFIIIKLMNCNELNRFKIVPDFRSLKIINFKTIKSIMWQ